MIKHRLFFGVVLHYPGLGYILVRGARVDLHRQDRVLFFRDARRRSFFRCSMLPTP